jgi:hypothetical protein
MAITPAVRVAVVCFTFADPYKVAFLPLLKSIIRESVD